MTRGQRAYERDLQERPTYHDGSPRPTWANLDSLARWSWEREPYSLPEAPHKAGNN